MPFAGAFTGKPAANLNETVLIKSSSYSQLVDSFSATAQGETAVRAFKPSGTQYALAVRLTGKFKTAFPGGRPEDKGGAKATATKPASEAKSEAPPLTESSAYDAVVLVGDSEFINA